MYACVYVSPQIRGQDNTSWINKRFRIKANGEVLERVQFFKFLSMWVQENLKWTDHIMKTVSSCFAALSIIKKIKNLALTALKKVVS